MSTAAARWLAGGLLGLTIAALAVSAGFGVAAHEWRDAFAFAPVLLAFAGVGAFVASHRTGNAIGWLFGAEGLWGALGVAGLAYAGYAVRSGAPAAASWAACPHRRSAGTLSACGGLSRGAMQAGPRLDVSRATTDHRGVGATDRRPESLCVGSSAWQETLPGPTQLKRGNSI